MREVEVDAAKHSDTALELLAHSFRGEVRSVGCDACFVLNESIRLGKQRVTADIRRAAPALA